MNLKKNTTTVIFLVIIAVFTSWFFYSGKISNKEKAPGGWESDAKVEEIQKPFLESDAMADIPSAEEDDKGDWYEPLERASERVTKKPFGIFITPQNSPISPERFSGYHNAVDFEVFPEELEAEVRVPVRAVCSGELLSKRIASGYGGLAVQECELEGEPVTVIYGHLKLSSISKEVGDEIEAGEILGFLGNGYSAETDGERKHLHLGIHKGSGLNMSGYVRSEAELSAWVDPCLLVCRENAE